MLCISVGGGRHEAVTLKVRRVLFLLFRNGVVGRWHAPTIMKFVIPDSLSDCLRTFRWFCIVWRRDRRKAGALCLDKSVARLGDVSGLPRLVKNCCVRVGWVGRDSVSALINAKMMRKY